MMVSVGFSESEAGEFWAKSALGADREVAANRACKKNILRPRGASLREVILGFQDED
jgi:hypothetical protein